MTTPIKRYLLEFASLIRWLLVMFGKNRISHISMRHKDFTIFFLKSCQVIGAENLKKKVISSRIKFSNTCPS